MAKVGGELQDARRVQVEVVNAIRRSELGRRAPRFGEAVLCRTTVQANEAYSPRIIGISLHEVHEFADHIESTKLTGRGQQHARASAIERLNRVDPVVRLIQLGNGFTEADEVLRLVRTFRQLSCNAALLRSAPNAAVRPKHER